ncbi:uncharacterized protein LOC129959649 [Argiope bruennichi]|uniref:uncharacterized protein LOC129959649 n=1 Tax=Argiope bruennichi TaxID=94029 RepID=UPI002494CEA0|nr:uncharacterized protein LOC129959649 [Argiope bruennichi]
MVRYTTGFLFASMGAQIKAPPGTGSYCNRIHGQIYHMVSPLYSGHNKPGYGQLYVFDTSEATEKRMVRNEGCLFSEMERLNSMLKAINPFIDCYQKMHRIMEKNPATNIRMVFMETRNLNISRYKQPITKTETAAIFVGDNGEPPTNQDICIYPVDDSRKNISPLSQCCDPMAYPLLFPRGELGLIFEFLNEYSDERCKFNLRLISRNRTWAQALKTPLFC